ncbi:MAG: aminotransferase class V-fold PLP-dependent enzyme, partial [Selenomonas sp.]|nr:aminotransferase class V-fold PLP-dependent enzyme [Selenomonas sp.]
MPVYLDYAATTPLDARVLMAMQPYLTEVCGNPSSLHCFGQAARRGVMRAREETAALIGASPSEVFFTSGGTESDNWALRGLAEERRKAGCRHIVTSAVEHPAVRETCRDLAAHGYALTEVPVDATGRVAPSDVAAALREDTALVTI